MINKSELLAEEHKGMRVDINGVLRQKPKAMRFMLGEIIKHLEQLAKECYSGKINIVDEFLQFYCLDDKRPSQKNKHTIYNDLSDKQRKEQVFLQEYFKKDQDEFLKSYNDEYLGIQIDPKSKKIDQIFTEKHNKLVEQHMEKRKNILEYAKAKFEHDNKYLIEKAKTNDKYQGSF